VNQCSTLCWIDSRTDAMAVYCVWRRLLYLEQSRANVVAVSCQHDLCIHSGYHYTMLVLCCLCLQLSVVCISECHQMEQKLADTTTELSACQCLLLTCQSDLTDRQKHYDDLIAARDETIQQLHSDSQLLQQRVNITSPHITSCFMVVTCTFPQFILTGTFDTLNVIMVIASYISL